MLADKKWDSQDGKENKFTNFEFYVKKIEILEEQILLISRILEQKGLSFKTEEETKPETSGVELDVETFERLKKGGRNSSHD